MFTMSSILRNVKLLQFVTKQIYTNFQRLKNTNHPLSCISENTFDTNWRSNMYTNMKTGLKKYNF